MIQAQHTEESSQSQVTPPFLKRVKIRNYKSIGNCDVALSPLTVLVGRNGAGKSNFLDALRFVVDGLRTSLDHAIKSRGGIEAVRRRSTGHPRNFAIKLSMELSEGRLATYGFEIAGRPSGGFVVKQEQLRLHNAISRVVANYAIEEGRLVDPPQQTSQQGYLVTTPRDTMPPATIDRLYLVSAAGLPVFREVYDLLLSMGFYNLNPEEMKKLQSPDAGELLHRDGGNIASVIARLSAHNKATMDRIKSYLETIVPSIAEVERVAVGSWETLEFRQKVVGSDHPWRFHAANMSDGTLRALGTLVAVTQLAERKHPVSLVGIEEPETALHPAAAQALMAALREAASHTQVLVTSHSPDLLDQIDPGLEKLLIAVSNEGDSKIAEVDDASQKAINEHLYTPGELLRMDQLEPDRADLKRQEQSTLFDTEDEVAT